jgi:hypothetical protein
MLYVGHFSFNGSGRFPDQGDEPEHGTFTTLVEAESIEAATARFEELLSHAKRTDDLFRSVTEVYLDACAELKSIPVGGVISHFEAVLGDPAPSMSVPLPGVDAEVGQAFSIQQVEDDDDDEAEEDRQPFLIF